MKKKRMPLETKRPTFKIRPFPPRRDYASLSIKDLLDAREAYHVHLSMLDNVVATAIGRYLIHEDDWYATHSPQTPRPPNVPRVTTPRTLANGLVRPWSWPAVLVFVRRWEQPYALGVERVPQTLYLPDGRVVPTCVVLATPDESLPPPTLGPGFASALLGGGYACVREHQGEQSQGTFGCLVRKGGTYYALTNRHVAGGDGEEVRAYVRGQYVKVGTTSNIAVDRLLISAAFEEWTDSHTYLTLDAGLVRIDDIGEWTSQAFGIGEIGEVFDATSRTITLDLIGCPVRAFGGSSGVTEGEIRALFFRYRSLGGFDYTTDVLIGPRETRGGSARTITHPGDSGTLWFYDPPSTARTHEDLPSADEIPERGPRARRLRPIAMQWGGERIVLPSGTPSAFALGSFLSTICRSLDVEVVRDWSTGHDEYWGKIGHFAIGWKACDQVTGSLATLMGKNQVRIGFGNADLGKGAAFRMDKNKFVPLSDVPDYVWIADPKDRPNEPIQHFADIDIRDIKGGPTMLDRCINDAKNVSAKAWKQYFDGFASKNVGPEEGSLPFRVWQIWDAMVTFLKAGDVLRFVGAAGILSHYVGDASQPLHCSFLHHGVPPMHTVSGRKYPAKRTSPEFKAFKATPPAQIHGLYEERMLEVGAVEALKAVDQALATASLLGATVKTGHGAAVATVRLMHDAQQRLSPRAIIDADDPTETPLARATALWNNPAVKTATIASLADSVRLLAGLWTAAWKRGGGDQLPKATLVQFSTTALGDLCRKESTFLPSLSLDEMAASGTFEP